MSKEELIEEVKALRNALSGIFDRSMDRDFANTAFCEALGLDPDVAEMSDAQWMTFKAHYTLPDSAHEIIYAAMVAVIKRIFAAVE